MKGRSRSEKRKLQIVLVVQFAFCDGSHKTCSFMAAERAPAAGGGLPMA